MLLNWIKTVSLVIALAVPVSALPYGDTDRSDYVIDYTDLSMILNGSVLDMGPSTHKPPKHRTVKFTGTRMQIGNFLKTRQEGNRVMMHGFEEPERAYLHKIRDELLDVPNQLPLSALSRNEQLAYWLNLHNIIVLAEIAEQYPVTNIKPFFDASDLGALVNQKRFSLNGDMISLADIQNHVITYWSDPLVIYGFYLGAVGTPNIRTTAYTGTNIYDELRDNAVDFVNSACPNVAATITVHHLMYNRNDLLSGGIRPIYYCLPVLKRNTHQQALINAATSGSNKFFLGTDSAPHPKTAKENACGCAAGCYSAHAAIELYAEAFAQENALDKLEGFASFHGADFYGLDRNKDTITLIEEPWEVPQTQPFGNDQLIPLRAGTMVNWRVAASNSLIGERF